jgi:hypothetical protein
VESLLTAARRPRGRSRSCARTRLASARFIVLGYLLTGCAGTAKPAQVEPFVIQAVQGSFERYDATLHAYTHLVIPAQLRSGDVMRTGTEPRHTLQLPAGGSVKLEPGTRFTVGALQDTGKTAELWLHLQEGHLFVVGPHQGRCLVESYRCRMASTPDSRASIDVREDRERFTNTAFRCWSGTIDIYGPRRKDPPIPLPAGQELKADDGGLKPASPFPTAPLDVLDPNLPDPSPTAAVPAATTPSPATPSPSPASVPSAR